MTDEYDILVVGAGPAGLAAAFFAADSSTKRVCLLDRNPKPGRKLLLSGSRQCNVTHGGPIEDFFSRYGGVKKGRFVKPALLNFDNRAAIAWFERLGVPLIEREDGKVFPKSLRSRDLLEALIFGVQERGVTIRTGCNVETVERNGVGFSVWSDRGDFQTATLVLATGGCSYPATGSDGDGFRIAEQFGHRIVPPRPALTPVYVEPYPFAESAGTAFRQVPVEIRRSGKRIQAGRGDVLLTHQGLSGPGILDLSRWIEPGDTVRVALTTETPRNLLGGKKTLKNALAPLGLSERFLVRLLETLDIAPERPASELSRDDRNKLESALAEFPFHVWRLGGWNEAMATAGGVALEEVDRRTMASRIVPGLFFCGEVLDVDGDTGGYNIQFALSTGAIADRPLNFVLGRSLIAR